MSKAVILGGGISGLSTAYYLLRQTANPKFSGLVLLEASNRLGGWIHSTKYEDGTVFDHGPRSFRPSGASAQNTLLLVDELNLESEVISVSRQNAAAKNRFIYLNGTIYQLPNSISSVFKKIAPFNTRLIWNIIKERKVPKSDADDESVYSFFERRFGKEIADYLIDPMCRGIYAGSARKLSIKSTFPDLFKQEKEKGAINLLSINTELSRSPPKASRLQIDAKNWSVWSLKNGCQQIVDRMADHIDEKANVRKNTPCTQLEFKDGVAYVNCGSDVIKADHVFSSIYSGDLAKVLPEEHGELAHELNSIEAVNTVVVNLEYEIEPPLKGFGHLLPSTEDGPVLGVVYDSCCFPSHDRKAETPVSRFTVMLGGDWYSELVTRLGGKVSPKRIHKLVADVMKDQLGIEEEPSKFEVLLQKNCIPQYRVGHAARLERIDNYIKNHNLPLSLVGSSYRGVSVNDCIYHARQAVERQTGPIPYIAIMS